MRECCCHLFSDGFYGWCEVHGYPARYVNTAEVETKLNAQLDEEEPPGGNDDWFAEPHQTPPKYGFVNIRRLEKTLSRKVVLAEKPPLDLEGALLLAKIFVAAEESAPGTGAISAQGVATLARALIEVTAEMRLMHKVVLGAETSYSHLGALDLQAGDVVEEDDVKLWKAHEDAISEPIRALRSYRKVAGTRIKIVIP